jgi:hypothetical protein
VGCRWADAEKKAQSGIQAITTGIFQSAFRVSPSLCQEASVYKQKFNSKNFVYLSILISDYVSAVVSMDTRQLQAQFEKILRAAICGIICSTLNCSKLVIHPLHISIVLVETGTLHYCVEIVCQFCK